MADKLNNETLKELINLQNNYKKAIDETRGVEDKILLIQESIAEKLQRINILKQEYNKLNESEKKTLKEIENSIANDKKNLKELTEIQKRINEQLEEERKKREKNVELAKKLKDSVVELWKYLQLNDKIIKTTILNLGMSGAKADLMRASFEKSAIFVARFGGDLAEIQKIMEGFADETERSRVLTSQMVNDITLIAKGTGLGIENATKLSSQFELMGVDVKTSMNYVQNVVKSSENMGINATKLLKDVSNNFKKLQTYNFQQGVKGFAQMAEYSQKMKIAIDSALNSAETARTLEGAIDMVAKLQVMGGEFAKLDMFETLYFARNDPAKLQEKIAGLTKGLVTLRKNSDGTFEKFISPADRDRLNEAAKILGISKEEMTEMALRAYDMDKMTKELGGTGLTDREKELIKGAAFFNSETGKFQVQIAGQMKNISDLTKEQAKSFASEQATLEKRAKEAMTFNETLKSTIDMLKSALLPLLKAINTVLLKPLSYLADLAKSGWGGLTIALLALGTSSVLLSKASNMFKKAIDNYVNSDSFFGGKGEYKSKSNLLNIFKSKKNIETPSVSPNIGNTGQLTGSLKEQGFKNLGTGAGIGAAALGIGAGIGAAAAGIGALADSLSKLSEDKAKLLLDIVYALGLFVTVGTGAALAITILGKASEASSLGLLAFGAAALMVGSGIGIAAAGIGYMSEGLAKMFKNIKGVGDDFMKVSLGIGSMVASFAVAGFILPQALALSFALNRISKNAEGIMKVGDAFKSINAVLSGNKEDYKEILQIIESISNVNVKSNSALGQLSKLLKEPIKVEFADKNISLNNNITLEIDGSKLFEKIYSAKIAIRKFNQEKNG